MNNVNLMGNVGTVIFDNNKEASDACFIFSMATSERYTDKANNEVVKTTWHKIVSFGQVAANLRAKVTTGSRLFVNGKIQSSRYKAEDGTEKESFDILVLSYIVSG